MKKIKTIISAMIIAVLSIFVSACSCSGGEDPGVNINHIYAQSLNINCLTNTDSVKSSVDPVSKDLYITCHVGDRFVIEYEITPSNATTTQVDWSFSALGLVQPYKSEGFSRNNSTKEQVEFEAVNRSDGNYKTTLSFTIHDLNKTAKCYIEVYGAVQNLSTFVAPENVSFDATTNSLTWSHISKVIDQYGDVVPAKTLGGYPKGLTGYEIQRLDPVTGEVLDTERVGKAVNKLEGIEAGVDYVYQVRATADGLEAKTSEYSKPFKFYKLKAVEEISNNNGEISFLSPVRSSKSVFYYFGVDNSNTYQPFTCSTATTSGIYKVNHNDFIDGAKNDKYNIEVVSFPDNYDAKLGYAVVGEEDVVRYYPSDASKTFVIEKLESPQVDLSTTKGTVTIDGVTFSNVNLSSFVTLSLEKSYTANYEQGFAYELYIEGSLQTPVKTGTVKTNQISIEGNTSNSYVLKVKTIGNSSTIESSVTTFKFNILSHLSSSNISLTDDVLHHESVFATGGVELFFVSTSNDSTNKQNYSVYNTIISNNNTDFNIQQLGLNAGKYDIYAKSLSLINSDYKNASIVPSTFSKIFTIDVAPMVSSNLITKDGVIMFKKLSNYNDYKVVINRKLKTELEYNEEQIVEIYAPTEANIRNGLLTYETSETSYDNFGNNARVSIEAIVKSYINDKYEGLDIKGFFGSDYEFKYSIITVGNGERIISSSPTTEFNIQRNEAVNNIRLSNYYLVFDRVGSSNKQLYTITLEVYNADGSLKNSYLFKDTVGDNINSNDEVEVNLNTLTIKGGSTTLAELVDTTAKNQICISALGIDGKVNSPAILSSIPTTKVFGLTTTPTELSLDENGVLSWNVNYNADGDPIIRNYNVYFYTVTNDTEGIHLNKINGNTIKGITGRLEGEDYILDANVADVLANYKDEIMAITVEEYITDLFTNKESSPFFAIRISAPTLTRVDESNNKQIVWTANDNANVYDIRATKQKDDSFEYTSLGSGATNLSITGRINGEEPWTEGIYTISVVARNTNNINTAGLEYTTPYVLKSVEATTKVHIVSASLDVTISDTKISWNNVCAGTSYMANYKIDYTLADGTTGSENLDTSRSYDATTFVAGTNSVTITPTVDFVETGFVAIGTNTTKQVKKLYAPSKVTSEDGNLVLYFDHIVEQEMTIDLYQVVGGKDTIVSSNKYYVSEFTNVELDNGQNGQKYIVILDGVDAGELVLKASVRLDGYLKSDLSSSYTGTKIAAVSDLTKIGDYFYWSAQPGISSYKIGFLNAYSNIMNYIDLIVEEQPSQDGNGYIYVGKIIVETPMGPQQITSTDMFDFDASTNKFKYRFIEELFITADQSGDLRFNIRPLTKEAGYFSGNTSQMITITKLNNNPQITVENGVVVFENYYANGSAIPTTYTLSIYKISTQEVTDEETGEVSTKVVRDETNYWTVTNNYTIQTEGYSIQPVDLNLIGLNLEGDYEIVLKFNGDGNYILDSREISVVEYDKLASTSLYTEKGVLTWSSVDGAESYTIQISDGKNVYETILTSTYLDEESIKPPEVINPLPDEGGNVNPDENPEGGEINPDENLGGGEEPLPDAGISSLAEGDTGFVFNPGTWYSVKVRVNATGKLHSRWSDVFMVQKLYAPTNLDVKASVGNFTIKVEESVTDENGTTITELKDRVISIGTPIITWKDDNNHQLKSNYSIRYSDTIENEIIYNEYLSYMLALNLPISAYNVTLKVYGNTSLGGDNFGYLTSNYSREIEVNYVDDVVEPTISEGLVTWNDTVKGAYAYKITAYKRSEYDAYLNAEEDPVLPTPVFSCVTATNTLNFQNIILANSGSYGGSFTFVINALTRPEDAIVTSDGEKTNTVNLFKPNTLVDYKVKNGKLNYKVAIADVIDFVEAQVISGDTKLSVLDESVDRSNTIKVAQYVLNYVMRKINLNVGENTALDEQVKHLLGIKLEVNNVSVFDTPDEAKIIDENGNEIKVVSGYTSAKYIEYSYNVAIDPDPIEDTPENPEDNTGDEGGNGEQTPPDVISAPVNANNEEFKYQAGKYIIRISALGNSVTDTPVVNGSYTASITAYKPNTPRTWTQDGADIYQGRVQWELSSTEKSTLENFVYYEDYQVRAVSTSTSDSIVTTKVSVNDTHNGSTNANLTDGYLYYRDLKTDGTNNGLFTIETKNNPTNRINKDTFYRLYISTVGTEDSTLLAEGETIYLNSNECLVNNSANILDVTKETNCYSGYLSWQTSFGSTATKLYIYGPFNCLTDDGQKVKTNWKTTETSAVILSKIDKVYNNDYAGLSDAEIAEYKNKLYIVNLEETDGIRQTAYFMNDSFDHYFAPGGYVVKFQEIGDGRGVIDSGISSSLYTVKLGTASTIATSVANPDDKTSIMQVAGWVGISNSYVYTFDKSKDAWKVKAFDEDAPNEKIGRFVWNPVAGANTYEINLYHYTDKDDNYYSESIYATRTQDTSFELPDGEAFNKPGYYCITIRAIRTSDTDLYENTEGYIHSDTYRTTKHERVAVPEALTIYGSGEIKWNYGYNYNDIGGYRVQFNSGEDGLTTNIIAETGTDSFVPTFVLGQHEQNGTVEISIKAIALSGNDKLNSGYCDSVKVTRLADPDIRLQNGVLYWGNVNGADPITSTELTTDGTKDIISTPEGEKTYNTYINYFTDITEHDAGYRSAIDELIYNAGSHTFSAMFQGTGGNEGFTMDSDGDFFISSNVKSLTATKLNAPVILNVTDEESDGENMVRWLLDENALGYRVRVFSSEQHSKDYPYVEYNISVEELLTLLENDNFLLKNVTENNGDESTYIYFKLNPVIDEFNVLAQNGGDLYIYVQALGSGLSLTETEQDLSARPADNTTLYLSSSYSTFSTIGVPPNPSNIKFDENTGILSWEVKPKTDTTLTSVYNVRIDMIYTVPNVTEEELNYWKSTSDIIGNVDNTRTLTVYDEIINRSISFGDAVDGLYTLTVVDVVMLKTSDYNSTTPLSYKVTSTGTNYNFTITAMTFVNSSTSFISTPVTPTPNGNYIFQTFDGGDGSEVNPYKISNLAQLQTISKFSDRAFILEENISLLNDKNEQTYWNIISEFSGTLFGNNKTIDKFAVRPNQVSATNSNTNIYSLFETNNGRIENLTIKLNDAGFYYNTAGGCVQAATVAINNNGTIDNVTTEGTIELVTNGIMPHNINTLAGGIVVNNNKTGIISNVEVNMSITALDDSDDFASASGIATNNYGTITNSHFNGSVTSNRVAGISAISMGVIDKCYVTSDSVINVTNKTCSGNGLKGAVAGGLVSNLTYNSTLGLEEVKVTNSYSLATINVTKGGDAQSVGYVVGGFIGTMDTNSSIEVSNCYTVVNIVKVSVAGSKPMDIYYMLGETSEVEISNNYYLVEKCELETSSSINTADVCEKVNSLDTLKVKLESLGNIYNVSGDGYPTFK